MSTLPQNNMVFISIYSLIFWEILDPVHDYTGGNTFLYLQTSIIFLHPKYEVRSLTWFSLQDKSSLDVTSCIYLYVEYAEIFHLFDYYMLIFILSVENILVKIWVHCILILSILELFLWSLLCNLVLEYFLAYFRTVKTYT